VARKKKRVPEPGTIADTVAQLAVWAEHAPHGLARAEFTNEFARQRVEAELQKALRKKKIAFHRIRLPEKQHAIDIVRFIVEQLQRYEGGVVSLSGFETAFKEPVKQAVGVLTLNRETLAGLPVCQIWWLTPSIVDAFIRLVPDLNSWFTARVHLTEKVHDEHELQTERLEPFETRAVDIADAVRQAAFLKERFMNALKGEASLDQLLQLALAAVKVLQDAGVQREMQELAAELLEALLANREIPGEENLDTAAVLSHLAELYRAQGRLDEAKELNEQALAITKKQLGANESDFEKTE
jgi:tetratricopeptide (TPR) repeat protein